VKRRMVFLPLILLRGVPRPPATRNLAKSVLLAAARVIASHALLSALSPDFAAVAAR
jgi:hypothetical protein